MVISVALICISIRIEDNSTMIFIASPIVVFLGMLYPVYALRTDNCKHVFMADIIAVFVQFY